MSLEYNQPELRKGLLVELRETDCRSQRMATGAREYMRQVAELFSHRSIDRPAERSNDAGDGS